MAEWDFEPKLTWTDAARKKLRAEAPVATSWNAVSAHVTKHIGHWRLGKDRFDPPELSDLIESIEKTYGQGKVPKELTIDREAPTAILFGSDSAALGAIVSYWVREKGLELALETAVRMFDFYRSYAWSSGAEVYPVWVKTVRRDTNGDTSVCFARREVPYLLRQIFEATKDEEKKKSARARAAELREGAPPHVRIALAVACNDATWGAEDVAIAARASEALALMRIVRDRDSLEKLAKISAIDPLVLLDHAGLEAVPAICAHIAQQTGYTIDSYLDALELVQSTEVARAFVELLPKKATVKRARAALEAMPHHTALALAKPIATQNKLAAIAEPLLAAIARNHPAAVRAAIEAATNAKEKKVLEACLASDDEQVEIASASELPPLLREPPWKAKKKKSAKLVKPALVALTHEGSIGWRPGEHEAGMREAPLSVARLTQTQILPASITPNTKAADDYVFEVLEKKIKKGFLPFDRGAGESWATFSQFMMCGWIGVCAPIMTDDGFAKAWTELGSHVSLEISYALARIGLRSLAGIVSRAEELEGKHVVLLQGVDSPEIATLMSRGLGKSKLRHHARAWFVAHPRAAAIGLIPFAFDDSDDGENARLGLQALLDVDHADLVREIAKKAGGDDAVKALESVLAFDPLARVPAKIPKRGAAVDPTKLRAPRLENGRALPGTAVEDIVTMLLFAPLEDPYVGTKLIREVCDEASLAAFAWEAFQTWLAEGGSSKDDWPMRAMAVFGNDDTARKLAPLIRAWPGESQHQRAVKALDILSSIGTDVALMHLHGIAEKVKFKGLQEQARLKIDDIARARGLTSDELGDRLIPDLDLEDNGSRELNFGPRKFRVGFDEHLAPFVVDVESNKKSADLPKAGKTDDKELAADATAIWKALKKDVKTIAAAQIHRLERAMCESRRWSPEVFKTIIVPHPLVIHLVRRLLWGVYDEAGKLQAMFRIAEDRTAATIEDDAFAIPETKSMIGIVHRLQLDDDAATKWAKVFADYELLPPFEQLERSTFAPTTEEKKANETKRFDQVMVKTRGLLGLETRGWRKGSPQDAGWIWNIQRKVGPQLLVDLQFGDGNGGILASAVGESPTDLPLGALTIRTNEWTAARTTFGQLNPVSFSEVIRDLDGLPR